MGKHVFGGLVVAALLFTSALAGADSPEPTLFVNGLGTTAAPAHSSDGALIWRVDDTGSRMWSFVVRNAEGVEQSGTLVHRDAPWVVWRPETTLEDGRYELEVAAETAFYGEVRGSTGVMEVGAPLPELVEIASVQPQWREQIGEQNCCSCQGDGDCQTVCWPQKMAQYLGFVVEFDTPPSSYLHQTTVTYEGGMSAARLTLGTGTGDTVPANPVVTDLDAVGPFCVSASIEDLDGAVFGTAEHCVDAADIPDPPNGELPDSTELIARCTSEPDDPTDPQWIEYRESDPQGQSKDSTSGGCSSLPAGRTGEPLVLVIAGLLFVGRLRR